MEPDVTCTAQSQHLLGASTQTQARQHKVPSKVSLPSLPAFAAEEPAELPQLGAIIATKRQGFIPVLWRWSLVALSYQVFVIPCVRHWQNCCTPCQTFIASLACFFCFLFSRTVFSTPARAQNSSFLHHRHHVSGDRRTIFFPFFHRLGLFLNYSEVPTVLFFINSMLSTMLADVSII